MKTDANHYVYAYFDPRSSNEMLYVGKGKGTRKLAHRSNKVGTAKEQRIHEIEKSGIKPLIRVIAANLTEEQALLVEKALIWRSGGSLTNVSGGHFAENFRPPNTLHLSLPGFDTSRGVYFVNVGEWEDFSNRVWEDCQKFGFLAAGCGRKSSSQLDRLEVGSIVVAYLNKYGYLGIGQVVNGATPVRHFRFEGRRLSPGMLKGSELLHDAFDDEKCEYLVAVKWIKNVPRDQARFRQRAGLFTPRSIVASLARQPKTLEYLEKEFDVDFDKLLSIQQK